MLNKIGDDIKNQFKVRKYEIKSYLHAIYNNYDEDQKKFIIFAQWRTGSTLLAQLLNSHPDIFCDIELFHKFGGLGEYNRTVFFPYFMIKGCASKFKTKAYGFDLKLYQIKNCLPKSEGKPKDFITKLHNNSWKIIYLRRMNIVRQAISNQLAHKRKQWHNWSHKPIKRSILQIDIDNLISQLELNENLTAEELQILEDIPHLKITYEENLLRQRDHQKTCDLIFEYLGLNKQPVSAKIKRISSDNLENVIENYSDILDKLGKTKYLKYMYED